MPQYCPKCGVKLVPGGKFCPHCAENVEELTNKPIFETPDANQSQPVTYGDADLWHQNYYRIRKKTLTIGNKYWLEDRNGTMLGFSKQKLFKLKEDIRIYTDESMSQELFQIKQEQILDAWGKFNVNDLATNTTLGYIKRHIISAFVKDTWELYTVSDQLVGKIEESSAGRALARKYLPGGALVPEKMELQIDGHVLANINQEFKIIGDIWEMDCDRIPQSFDRRVLIACVLLMGMIERSRK